MAGFLRRLHGGALRFDALQFVLVNHTNKLSYDSVSQRFIVGHFQSPEATIVGVRLKLNQGVVPAAFIFSFEAFVDLYGIS